MSQSLGTTLEEGRHDAADAAEGCREEDALTLETDSESGSEEEDEAEEGDDSRVGPRKSRRIGDWRCVRALWALGARCIIFDFTYVHVWSRFLAFATFMLVVMVFSEKSFDTVLLVKSSGKCADARAVMPCTLDGRPDFAVSHFSVSVPVDPFEGLRLHLGVHSFNVLFLALWVGIVNSRYLQHRRCLASICVPFAALQCTAYTSRRFADLFHCGSGRGTVDWTPYLAERGNVSFPAPPRDRIDIAEYCVVQHDTDDPLRTELGAHIKNIWAAWMDAAVFEVRMNTLADMQLYCDQVGLMILPSCIHWLNTSSLGNSLKCDAGASQVSVPMILYMYKRFTKSQEVVVPENVHLSCIAQISGRNFALGDSMFNSSVITPYLLALATRGLNCPTAWGLDGQGPQQVDSSAEDCVFDRSLVQLDLDAGPGGTRLRPRNGTTSYLQHDFFHCVTDGVYECSARQLAATRTVFRSATSFLCGFAVLAGLAWALYLRYSDWPWQPWRGVSSESLHVIRVFLGSRITRAYSLALLLQIGFLVLMVGATPAVVRRFPQEHYNRLLVFLVRLAFWSQSLIVVAAIWANTVGYFRLRKQIMDLPRETFFGDEPTPMHYQGPDLSDLREMGQSSVLYAMYFPGILFWRFFFGSWILAILLAVLVGLFIVALSPFWRGPYSEHIWMKLSSMLFLASILCAHFMTRLYMQRCLMRQTSSGMRLRCVCLFAWWEILTFFLGLALGPFTTLYDFVKSLFATTLSSLIVWKPNFIQFGELSDYVYCTYCAVLYLERVAEDLERVAAGQSDWHGGNFAQEGEIVGCTEFVELEDRDAEFMELDGLGADLEQVGGRRTVFWLEEPGFRHLCPARCLGCMVTFLGVPSVTSIVLNLISVSYGYPCQDSVFFMPSWFCQKEE